MNKQLFSFIAVLVLFISLDVSAAATSSLAQSVTNMIPTGTILDTLIPSRKNCNYVDKKQYEPFSDINANFPGAKSLINKGKDGKTDCVSVTNGTEGLLSLLFTVALSLIIVMTVVSIAVAGIQYMTEQATGQIKGGARKRLINSFIALALALLSYTILYTINKQLVNFTFNPVSIDLNNRIADGIKDANIAALYSGGTTALVTGAAVPYAAGQISPTGYVNVQTGAPCTPVAGVPESLSPCVKQVIPTPTPGDSTTPGNYPTYAAAGTIRCNGAICTAGNATVFGYKDGDGTVGRKGDNGIGNALWSDKPGCAFDTGNTVTMGVALPKSFWGSAGINTSDVKYVGIKVYINGIAQRILPIVDDSQENLDFTFAAARALIDPTITNSNRLNTSGKAITFEIVRDYYRTTQKTDVVYTSNNSTFSNKMPCTI